MIAVYAGTHLSFLSSLEKVHLATLQNIFQEDSTCFLGIEATIEEKETNFYLDLLYNEIFYKPTDFSPLCRFEFSPLKSYYLLSSPINKDSTDFTFY